MNTAPVLSELLASDVQAKPSDLVTRMFGAANFHTAGDLCALRFAADGTIWSIDETGVLQHWSETGEQLRRSFLSDLETLWTFSPDASLLASGNDDLILWDTKAGQLLARIPQPCWVTAIAFSPDGHTVVSGHDDGSVRFFDVRSQRLIGDVLAHSKEISALAFTPAGDVLATASESRTVKVWDAVAHKEQHELVSHTDRVPALAWSADGQTLISAGWDTSARVWRPGETADPIMLLNSHADQVVAAVSSPDGQVLATADSDFEIHLWSNPGTAKVKHVLRGHIDDIRAMAFNADGTRLASGGSDRVIHLWDVTAGKLLAGPNPTGKHAVAYTGANPPLLASTGSMRLRVWNRESGAEVPPSNDGPALTVAASADGRWIAVGSTDHTIRLYDRSTVVPTARILESTKPPIGAMAFSPDGSLLAQASQSDGLVWLWNPANTTGNPELILIEAADGCTLEALAIHPNNTWVAVGGVDVLSTGERDGAVCIWDANTKEKVTTFDVGVNALAFDPQGRYLAGAGLTDNVHIWDLAKDEEVFCLDGHQGRINCVAFSPDGNFILSGGDDATIRVWDTLGGRLIVAREFDSPIQALAFTPDGQTLFTGNGNTTCHEIAFKSLIDA